MPTPTPNIDIEMAFQANERALSSLNPCHTNDHNANLAEAEPSQALDAVSGDSSDQRTPKSKEVWESVEDEKRFGEIPSGIILPCLSQRSRSRTKRRYFGIQRPSKAERLAQHPIHINPDDYNQRYPKDERYMEMAPNARIWRTYLDEASTFDIDMVEGWKDSIDVLLVFAGLFSAVVTTFVTQTSQSLKLDHSEVAVSLLGELVALQRAALNGSSESIVPPSVLNAQSNPTATMFDFWTNLLWFVSLAFSLTTALGAVLAKQWLQYYMASTTGTPHHRVRIHQLRFRGLDRWNVSVIIGVLPILLHIAVFLFFAGLVSFLVPLKLSIAKLVGSIAAFSFIVYLILAAIPAFKLECPYKTPLSFFLHYVIFLLPTDFFSFLSHTFPYSPPHTLVSSCFQRWITGVKLHVANNAKARHTGDHQWPKSFEARTVQASKSGHMLDAQALQWLHSLSSNPSVHDVVLNSLCGFPVDFSVESTEFIYRSSIGDMLRENLASHGLPRDLNVKNIVQINRCATDLTHRWTNLEHCKSLEPLMRGLYKLRQSKKSVDNYTRGIGRVILKFLSSYSSQDLQETSDCYHLWIASSLLSDDFWARDMQSFLMRGVTGENDTKLTTQPETLPPSVWAALFEALQERMCSRPLYSRPDALQLMLEFLRIVPSLSNPLSPSEHLVNSFSSQVPSELFGEVSVPLASKPQLDRRISYAIIECTFSIYVKFNGIDGVLFSGLPSSPDARYCYSSILVWLECLKGTLCKDMRLRNYNLTLFMERLIGWVLYAIHYPEQAVWYTPTLRSHIRGQVKEFVRASLLNNPKPGGETWSKKETSTALTLCFVLFNDRELQQLLDVSNTSFPPLHLLPGITGWNSHCQRYYDGRYPPHFFEPNTFLRRMVTSWLTQASLHNQWQDSDADLVIDSNMSQLLDAELGPRGTMELVLALFNLASRIIDSPKRQSYIYYILSISPLFSVLYSEGLYSTLEFQPRVATALKDLRRHVDSDERWEQYLHRVMSDAREFMNEEILQSQPWRSHDTEKLAFDQTCQFLDVLAQETLSTSAIERIGKLPRL